VISEALRQEFALEAMSPEPDLAAAALMIARH
jgi:hypothetical protein